MHARRITLLPPRSFRVFSLTQLTFFFDRIRVQDDIVDGIAGIVPYLFVCIGLFHAVKFRLAKKPLGGFLFLPSSEKGKMWKSVGPNHSRPV